MQGSLLDNRYGLLDAFGSGGMALVHVARDRFLERDAAIKLLREQYAENEEFAERFRGEAHNAAALPNPNIVAIYDRGTTEDGAYYIAMEHAPDGTLKERFEHHSPLVGRRAAPRARATAFPCGHPRSIKVLPVTALHLTSSFSCSLHAPTPHGRRPPDRPPDSF